jgi:tetratricopeptide (TPR) repeat protein
MKITLPKLKTSQAPASEHALDLCRKALELRDKGNHEAAERTMRPLWKRMGARPEVEGLPAPVAAEVLLCVGVLTGSIGSKDEIKDAQEKAKNLITESITLYESLGDITKIAMARAEIAYCYWREGALDDARVMFNQAIQKLTTEGNTRAKAILRLAIVEWSASRFSEALKLLTTNAPLFNKITSHALKGAYHNQLALALRHLATTEKRDEYFQEAIREYEQADHHLKLAQNTTFRALVKNNVGFLLFNLSRYKEAHKYLEEARRLTVNARNKVRTAQIDETIAQVFLAENKLTEAENAARQSASSFEKNGRHCLLAEALITQGIALARLHKTERAEFTFQKAIEVAHQAGALNIAGMAALTMIEEIDQLSSKVVLAAYERASNWLSESQDAELLLKLNRAAQRVFSGMYEMSADEALEILLNKPPNLEREVLQYERGLIRRALARADGSITRTAESLGMSYQGLAYVLETRHRDLIKERSPIRRRLLKTED